jgi:hypothetical protein
LYFVSLNSLADEDSIRIIAPEYNAEAFSYEEGKYKWLSYDRERKSGNMLMQLPDVEANSEGVAYIYYSNDSLNLSPSDFSSERIIDDEQAEKKGRWVSDRKIKGYYGKGYGHDLNIMKGKKLAKYKALVPHDNYELYLWRPSDPILAQKVPVIISATRGTYIIQDNQQLEGGMWKYLGSYEMDEDSFVEINTHGTEGIVAIDAVRFDKVSYYSSAGKEEYRDGISPVISEEKETKEFQGIEEQKQTINVTGPNATQDEAGDGTKGRKEKTEGDRSIISSALPDITALKGTEITIYMEGYIYLSKQQMTMERPENKTEGSNITAGDNKTAEDMAGKQEREVPSGTRSERSEDKLMLRYALNCSNMSVFDYTTDNSTITIIPHANFTGNLTCNITAKAMRMDAEEKPSDQRENAEAIGRAVSNNFLIIVVPSSSSGNITNETGADATAVAEENRSANATLNETGSQTANESRNGTMNMTWQEAAGHEESEGSGYLDCKAV